MNLSNLMAWLMCLILAFFAVIMGIFNRTELTVAKKKLDALDHSVLRMTTWQHDKQFQKKLEDTLDQIREHVEKQDYSTDAAVRQAIEQKLKEMEQRLQKLEKE